MHNNIVYTTLDLIFPLIGALACYSCIAYQLVNEVSTHINDNNNYIHYCDVKTRNGNKMIVK